jgi:predicted nucleotidyltransferase
MLPYAAHAMISRFVAACQADERVVAAMLYGSYAEGTHDVYSDLDLGLLTTDEAHESFLVGRTDFLRQLGELLFVEDFDLPNTLFVIFADGSEVELKIGRESEQAPPHDGAHRVLLDRRANLTSAVMPRLRVAQTEALRRQIIWFWHDLAHFMAAIGREQLWWAHGQLDELRRSCVDLARLQYDITAEPEGYWKLDTAIPVTHIAVLQMTYCPLERGAMLHAVHVIIRFYQELAPRLAQQHGIAYPAELERLMLDRLTAFGEPPSG